MSASDAFDTAPPSVDVFKKIRVLVVDDSALMRRLLSEMLGQVPDIEVIDTAADAYKARAKIKKLNPDVITLDVEMPGMDGLSFLRNLMRLRPMPVVMVSTQTEQGAQTTLRALEIGAVGFVHKPKLDLANTLADCVDDIAWEIRKAASAGPEIRKRRKPDSPAAPAAAAVLRTFAPETRIDGGVSQNLIAVGASTGGTEAITRLMQGMAPGGPGIVITQHIPAGFSRSFSQRLDGKTALYVHEAEHGMIVHDGHVYIAPGDQHLKIERSSRGYRCLLDDGERVSYHKPSVDVLFASVARAAGAAAVGVILTGMGRDGASGLLDMRNAGAVTLAQDERSCVVYGMPRAAFEEGAVDRMLPLDLIAGEVMAVAKQLRP